MNDLLTRLKATQCCDQSIDALLGSAAERIAELEAERNQLRACEGPLRSEANRHWRRVLELAAENAALRKTLEEIADADPYAPGIVQYARAALARIPQPTPQTLARETPAGGPVAQTDGQLILDKADQPTAPVVMQAKTKEES